MCKGRNYHGFSLCHERIQRLSSNEEAVLEPGEGVMAKYILNAEDAKVFAEDAEEGSPFAYLCEDLSVLSV